MSSSHDITLTPQEQALIMRLKSFRVPEMAHILEEQLKDPNADLNTFMERMTAMVDAEWQARADKRFNRLMKEAHLRYRRRILTKLFTVQNVSLIPRQ